MPSTDIERHHASPQEGKGEPPREKRCFSYAFDVCVALPPGFNCILFPVASFDFMHAIFARYARYFAPCKEGADHSVRDESSIYFRQELNFASNRKCPISAKLL